MFVCWQYDFVELLDGSRLIAKEHRAPSELDHPVLVHQAGFIQYLDSGVWHLAFYNDGRNVEAVSYNTIIQGTQMRVCCDGFFFSIVIFLSAVELTCNDMFKGI